MSYKETDFQRELRHKHEEVYSFASEQKIVKTKSYRFNQIQDHQISYLLSVDNGSFFYKFNDFYIKNKTLKKPFDSLFFGIDMKGRAFLLIMFYIPYKKKNVYWIEINDYLALEQSWPRKSIKEEELAKFAYKVQDFLKIKTKSY